MSLYRNLGPIRFSSETEFYQIFQTLNQTLILQLKQQNCEKTLDIQTLVSNFLSIDPTVSLPIAIYTEKGKPQSILLSEMQPFKFNQISIQNLCNVIQVIVKVMQSWEKGTVGEIHEDLFFNFHGKIVFFSLPLIQSKTSLKTKILGFLEKINTPREDSRQILLNRLKQCKDIEGILQQTRYFCKISNLKCTQNSPKLSYNLLKQTCSAHSQKNKLTRRKYLLFKKNENDTSLIKSKSQHKQFSFGKQNEDLNYKKNSSKAIHVSNSMHLSNRSSKGFNGRSPNYKSTTHSLRYNGLNLSQSPKKDFYNSFTKCIKKNTSQNIQSKEIRKSGKQSKSTQVQQNLKQNRENTNLCKSAHLNSEAIKDLVNKSILKWSQNNDKLIIKNQGNITKKKLKKTGQFVTDNRYQVDEQLSEKSHQVYIPLPIQSQKIEQKEMKREVKEIKENKEYKNSTNNPKIEANQKQYKKPRPIIDKIPLKGHGQDFLEKQTERKNTKPKELSLIQQLDYIGEAVANTSSYLKKFQKIFWQLPMFFLYKFFYAERVKVEKMGYKDLKGENQNIEKSLKKLLSVVIKKIKKAEELQENENLEKHLNMNLSIQSKDYRNYIVKQYIQSLVAEEYPELECHLIEVIDAFLFTQGHEINIQQRKKCQKDKQYQKTYLKLRLEQAIGKL